MEETHGQKRLTFHIDRQDLITKVDKTKLMTAYFEGIIIMILIVVITTNDSLEPDVKKQNE